MTLTLMLAAMLAAAAIEKPLTAPGPDGPLAGTLVDAGKGAPVVLILPGSGPTDRHGNNRLGVTAASYRLLAEGLAERGVSSVRIDKRGMFASKAAIADPNKVTIADYAADAHAWAATIRKATGAQCVWLLGHSEGALIALAAGQRPDGICGIVTVSGPGRKLGDVIREQLKANPANAPILDIALATLAKVESGEAIDSATLPAALQPLFYNDVQPFLRDLLSHDPARLAGSLEVPLLVVQGDKDIQVSVEDAKRLAAAQPKAKLAVLPQVNHVLKIPAGEDRGANLATYADASLPIAPSVFDAVTGFVKP
jgi:hypothetical protein